MCRSTVATKGFIIFIVLIIFLVSPVLSGNNHAASYMRMGVGARALSMGGAFTAVSNDVSSVYWNPAGLTYIDKTELGAMYSTGLGLDRSYHYAGIASKIFLGTIGVSWINATWKGFEGYDEYDNKTGNFDVVDNNLNLSYAFSLKILRVGGSLKFYSSSIQSNARMGLGTDVGLILYLQKNTRIGVMVRDLYSQIGDDVIPLQVNSGLAFQPVENFVVAGDLRFLLTDMEKVNYSLGMEYKHSFKDINLAGRAGVDIDRFNFGLGIGWNMVQFNYAFIPKPIEVFDDSHRFAVVFRF